MSKKSRIDEQPDLLGAMSQKTAVAEKPTETVKIAKESGKVPAKASAGKSAKAKAKVEKTANVPAPYQPPRSLLEAVMVASVDPRVDPVKMQALLDMAREEERREAESRFDEAMLAAQAAMPQVPRDAYNQHTKSWWARIESVSQRCDPVIRQHGFTLSYGMGPPRIDDFFHVYADVTWRGQSASGKTISFTKRYSLDIGRDDVGAKGGGTKTGAQGSISVLTYGRRNLKLVIFDVIVLGMDRDGNPAGQTKLTKEQLKTLREKLKEANTGDDLFCSVFKIDKVEHLAAEQYEAAISRLEQKINLGGASK